jgi:Zn-dependent peptidase ImmA (M78 family)
VPDLPLVSRSHDRFTWSDVDKLAFDVRRWLNLGDAPAFTLRRSLEDRCGIKVFHDAFEPLGTAACVKSDTHGWAVLLNVKNSPVRRHYDLAHELFHLLTWGIYRTHDEASSSSIPEEENFANAFASSLLLPAQYLDIGRQEANKYRSERRWERR